MTQPPALPATLKDGTSIELRPLTAEDKALLEDGFARLSEESRRLRFLTPTDRLSRNQLSYLTELDFVDHVAWAALHEGSGIGVARFVRTEGQQAEVAVTVTDQFQGRGLGRLLVAVLAAAAPICDVDTFEFVMLPENAPMRHLLSGWGGRIEVVDGLVRGTVPAGRIPLEGLNPEVVRTATASMRNPG